jgi:hypothetical protein
MSHFIVRCKEELNWNGFCSKLLKSDNGWRLRKRLDTRSTGPDGRVAQLDNALAS